MKMLPKILCLYIALFMIVGCVGNTNEQSTTDSSANDFNTESIKKDIDTPKVNKYMSPSELEGPVHQDSEDTAKKSDINADVENTELSLKEEYLKKLNDTKKETENLKATDPSTYAEKKVANDRWEIWDGLLNEIYGVLKEQLPPEEMDHLRQEQRNWIEYREDSALEASSEYKGGTQEHLEYVIMLAKLTEERCYELVEEYV